MRKKEGGVIVGISKDSMGDVVRGEVFVTCREMDLTAGGRCRCHYLDPMAPSKCEESTNTESGIVLGNSPLSSESSLWAG